MLNDQKKITRHGPSVILVHWVVALSTFVLIFSGFGQMPIYSRYMLDQVPGLSWVSDFSVTLVMHYWAAALLMGAIAYHVVLHGIRREFDMVPRRGDLRESGRIIMATFGFGEEPENDKYLAEQRLGYAFIGSSLVLVIVTGILKVLKNLPYIHYSEGFTYWVTFLHNIGTVLVIIGIVVHLGAFLFKTNWPLLPGIFTGKVDRAYAKRRHAVWYRRTGGGA